MVRSWEETVTRHTHAPALPLRDEGMTIFQALPDRPTVGGMGRVSVTRHRVVRAWTGQ